MNEQNLYRDSIPTIPESEPRPLWSVMIPTYNCAHYLRETLASVLAQDPGPEIMQIEVVDDCSTKDNPQAVVEELGKGRVGFYRQPENVRHVRNFNTCLRRARGKIIHLLHGDDYVRHGFYQKLQQPFEQNPEIGAAFCRHIDMDEQGNWQRISRLEQTESGLLKNWLEEIATGQRLNAPSIVVRRDVYEKLGGFDRRISCCGEDWEMWVRIATQYPVWYEVEPLAVYRLKGAKNLSASSLATGGYIRDMRIATEIIESYLPSYMPKQIAVRLSSQAREMYAHWALGTYFWNGTARQLLAEGNGNAAITLIQEGLKCSYSPSVIKSLLSLFIGEGIRRLKIN